MPGWIIQGVRGEGKSLAAVHMIKKYMLQGRPVATNLDLYLENLLPEDNQTLAYRLPDHPRLQDFELLPPAYDRKYKGEDKNGLLVLDELGTWLNSRNWNQKDRLTLLNWLFLSRKDHWDLILLAQDHEMIDAQVRTTLCDYLVQASRLDRLKIPYFSNLLKFFGMNAYFPRIHRYHVFYGLSTQQNPIETWTIRGTDIYDAYDTNQRFRDGTEALCGTLVDMRATYTYLPCSYLTRHVFIARLQKQIDHLKITPDAMAIKKSNAVDTNQLKIIFLSIALVVFLVWRFLSGGFNVPKSSLTTSLAAPVPAAAPVNQQPTTQPLQQPVKIDTSTHGNQSVQAVAYKAQQPSEVLEYLLTTYRPRLSLTVDSPDLGIIGNIDFYENNQIVETYSIHELHAFGATVIKRPYGADLVYSGKVFAVTSWKIRDTPIPTLASDRPLPIEKPAKPEPVKLLSFNP